MRSRHLAAVGLTALALGFGAAAAPGAVTPAAYASLPLSGPRSSPADQALADRILAGTPRMSWPAAGR
jgi:hypothetical protein